MIWEDRIAVKQGYGKLLKNRRGVGAPCGGCAAVRRGAAGGAPGGVATNILDRYAAVREMRCGRGNIGNFTAY